MVFPQWKTAGRLGTPRHSLIPLIVLGLCLATRGSAQRYSFKNYGPDYGLVNLAVNSLAQDSAGYLGVETQARRCRYGGYRFYRVGRLGDLPSLDVRALAAAPDGSVWVGTRQG